jgi:adenosylcobinamide-phosphate synthase
VRSAPARRQRLAWRAAATSVGLLADRSFGEPPVEPHPVALFGSAMHAVERHLHRDTRAAGVAHATIGAALGAGAGLMLRSTALATYVAVAMRGLADAAHDVAEPLMLGDLDHARRQLPALVGRDPSQLDAAEIARAVVESVAENTTDAVVAPAWWALVGGAPGALCYRAINTMDAMVGHHSPRYENYGWASARLDDIANYVPARLTAALVIVARPSRTKEIVRAVRADAPAHPSPNAGVAEAAFAAALGLRLGGTNVYGERVEARAPLGSGRPAEPGDIAAAIRLAEDVAAVLAMGLALLAIATDPQAKAVRHRRNRTATRRSSPRSNEATTLRRTRTPL